MNILKTIIVLNLLALASCNAKSDIFVLEKTAYIKGYIDKNTYFEFSKLSLENIDRVNITSAGGESLPAFRIAHLIKDYKISVEADKFCLSACASIIFVAGQKRYVSKDTLLAFHIGSYSRLKFYEFAQSNGVAVTPSNKLIRAVQEEKRLYQRVGADRNILLLSMTLRGKPCYIIEQRADGTNALRAGFSLGGGFIPTKALFASYGIDVEGDNLPKNGADLKRIEKNLPPHDNFPFLALTNETDIGLSEQEILDRIDFSNYKACLNHVE